MNSPVKQHGSTVFNSYPELISSQHNHHPAQENLQQAIPPSSQAASSPLGSAQTRHRTNKILSYKERSPLTEKKR
jgi:hypothetical protein